MKDFLVTCISSIILCSLVILGLPWLVGFAATLNPMWIFSKYYIVSAIRVILVIIDIVAIFAVSINHS